MNLVVLGNKNTKRNEVTKICDELGIYLQFERISVLRTYIDKIPFQNTRCVFGLLTYHCLPIILFNIHIPGKQ